MRTKGNDRFYVNRNYTLTDFVYAIVFPTSKLLHLEGSGLPAPQSDGFESMAGHGRISNAEMHSGLPAPQSDRFESMAGHGRLSNAEMHSGLPVPQSDKFESMAGHGRVSRGNTFVDFRRLVWVPNYGEALAH